MGCSPNCIPKIYDEHKLTKLSQNQKDLISEMVRNVYNNLSGSRGKSDQGQIEYPYTAPVIILGEQGLVEIAHRDRIVDVFMSIQDRKSKEEYKNNFNELSKLDLRSFGNGFLKWSLSLDDSFLDDVYRNELASTDRRLKDRVRVNTAFARFGVSMLIHFLEEHNINVFFRDFRKLIDDSQIKNLGVSDNRKSVVDETIEGFATMADQDANRISYQGKVNEIIYYLNEYEDYHVKDGDLRLNISKIYPKFSKWAKDFQWDGEVLSKEEFVKQLRHSGYYKDYRTVNISKSYWKGYILDLDKMKHLDLNKWQGNLLGAKVTLG